MSPSFADELAPAMSSTLKGLQAPPPPPPKGNFADGLAAFFGGGPDIQGAYNSGLDARAKTGVQSAQTLSALAEAEKRRQDAMRTSLGNDIINKALADPNYAGSFADSLPFATSANDYMSSRLGGQEFDNRAILGDPTAANADVFAAGRGVKGEALPQVQSLGAGREINMLTQQTSTNPIGEAQIANYGEQPAATTRPGAGQYTLGGVRYNADGTPAIDVGTVAANSAQVAQAVSAARAPPAGTAGSKPLTEFQVKAMGQLSRMDRTEALLGTPEMAEYAPSLADVAVDAVPGLGNYAVSKQYQNYKQAANEWISGLLRLDSGAAVPESEFKTYFRTFFPQPGDGPEAKAQKKAGREAATAALRAGLPQIAATIEASRPPAAPGAPAAGGWTKQTSPSTGAVRWINKATGETRSTAP